jgi:type IV pilus assembly protein PilA
VVVVVALISVAVIGIVAAIAIPGLVRARMVANEASAIAGIRNLISAEVSYSVANGGFPDVPDCLVNPGKCQPAYSGPPLLDAPYASTLPRSGYVFQFHPGTSVDSETIKARGLSPTSLVGFAYTAEPATPAATGVRSFCGDYTGVVCSAINGVPTPVDGSCPARCQPVR